MLLKAAYRLLTLAHQDHIIMVLDVFHINLVIKEEFGMINNLNVFALILLSGMVFNVLDVHLDNNMQLEDVSVHKVLSLMESNVLLEPLIDVFLLLILTGMELTVFVSQDFLQATISVSVKASLSVIIVKDVLLNQIQFSEKEFVNVTMDSQMLMVSVHLKLQFLFNVE
jgi:hypothetical protein